MDQSNAPNGPPGPTARKISWVSALMVWVAISIAGWAVIVGVFTILSPEQTSQIATEDEPGKIEGFAPAAGDDSNGNGTDK